MGNQEHDEGKQSSQADCVSRAQVRTVSTQSILLVRLQVRIAAAANETFGVWREGQHDDLVLAVALACWWAERSPRWGPDACTAGGRTLVSQAPPGVFFHE
jgi:hypothetical protein